MMNKDSSQIRDTNIELLRIVLAFFVVFHHFIVHAAFPNLLSGEECSHNTIIATLVNGFPYVAVNCFVLISGYYGIKFKWKGLLNIYLILFCYSVCNYLVEFLCGGVDKSIIQAVKRTVFCISHSHLWFVICYVALYLMAPLLNYCLNNVCRRNFINILVLFTIINIYFGFFLHTVMNSNGYTIAQMVYLYIIGRYIGRFVVDDVCKRKRWYYFMFYCVFSVFWGLMVLLQKKLNIVNPSPWGYNNPVLIISAISFLLFFLTFNMNNKHINFWAKGSFAVIVFTTEPFIEAVIYDKIGRISNITYQNIGLAAEFTVLIVSSLITVTSILLIDSIRRVFMTPFWRLYDKLHLAFYNRVVVNSEGNRDSY